MTAPASFDVPCLAGTLVVGFFDLAREVLGREVVERALSGLPDRSRASIDDALPGTWVPISDVEAALARLAEISGRPAAALHEELARLNVERALKTVWRLLLRFTSDEALVSRTPVLFAKAYNRGRLVTRVTGAGAGEVELVDWANPPEWPVRGNRVAVETVLRLAGRKDVRVEARRLPRGALYTATWA